MKRPSKLVVAVALVAVVLGGLAAAWAGGLLFGDTAVPASVAEALARFRAADPHPTAPVDGVYEYATRGSESVDALGGATHRYPRTTTVTVISRPCGVELRWDGLQGRATTWRLCGLELRVLDHAHRFFGRDDRTTYSCRGLRRFHCKSGTGVQDGTAVVDGRHVRMVGRVSGGDAGVEHREWWLRDDGLPLKIVLSSRTSRKFLILRVHYREDVTLSLLSSKPRR